MTGPAFRPDQHFTLSPSVRTRRLDRELILLDLRQGHYFSLNANGAAVWHALERGLSYGAMDAELAGQWPVPEDQRHAMLETLMNELVERGLLEPGE